MHSRCAAAGWLAQHMGQTRSNSVKPNRNEDNTMNDAIALCLLLAVLYVAYKAYATLLGA